MSFAAFLWTQSRLKVIAFVATGLLAGLSYTAVVAVMNAAVTSSAAWTVLAVALATVCVIHLAARLACTQIMLDLAQTTLHELRLDLCRRILATPQEKLRGPGRHRLLTVLTQDIESLAGGYEGLVELFRNGIVIIACLLYLGWQYWPFLLVFGSVLLVGMTLVDRLKGGPTRLLVQVRASQAELHGRLHNLVDGVRELQINSRRGRDYVDRIVAPHADGIRGKLVRGLMGFSLVLGAGEVVYFLAIGALLFVVPHWLTVPPGGVARAAVTLLFMSAPINDALQALPRVTRARAALDHIKEVRHFVPKARAGAAAGAFAAAETVRLDLHDVAYRYEGEQGDGFELGPLSFSASGGNVVFVAGGNGAGKSTLAMVLVGLLPAAGEIRLNGRLLTERDRAEYCEHFSVIFSDFHLFETVPDAGSGDVDERAAGYLRMLALDHKVRVKDGSFSTVDLSAGQRKRLAMVGALLEDRPIYLLDEWAADQDPAFKRLFYRELLPTLKAAGKIVIVITHDDAYFHHADILLRLENGMLSSATVPVHAVSQSGFA